MYMYIHMYVYTYLNICTGKYIYTHTYSKTFIYNVFIKEKYRYECIKLKSSQKY